MKYMYFVLFIIIAVFVAIDTQAEIYVSGGNVYTDLPGFNGPTIQTSPIYQEDTYHD
jgi:hypothetical protein